jgi:hypothetical protein
MNQASRSLVIEVIRGREPGRRYTLAAQSSILGGSPGGPNGLEIQAPAGVQTRMLAPRHASIEMKGADWLIRDLESDSGTFVNRQRILPGQVRPIRTGDMIELGPVQLRVAEGVANGDDGGRAAHPSPPVVAEARGSFVRPIEFSGGLRCKNWDELVSTVTHKWTLFREWAGSGELARRLSDAGLGAWAPNPSGVGGPDERLDAWIGGLPVKTTADLEIHPARLTIRAGLSGGVTRRTISVQNVGQRLLRWKASVAGGGEGWLRVVSPVDERVTVESDSIELEAQVPEHLAQPVRATVEVHSNAGTRRLEVVVEPADSVEPVVGSGVSAGTAEAGRSFLLGWPLSVRLMVFGAVFLLARVAIGLSEGVFGVAGRSGSPALEGPIIGGAILGGVFGLVAAVRRRAIGDLHWCAIAGALAGGLAATLGVALGRTIEPWLGTALGPITVAVAWATCGALLAGLSALLIPFVPKHAARVNAAGDERTG